MQARHRQPLGLPDHGGTAWTSSESPIGGPDTKGRVLVVHEHPLLASALQAALADCGWAVETSCSGTVDEVLGSAAGFHPDCILLDVDHGAAVGNGIELIRPLVTAGNRVVMLTEEGRRLVLAECLEAGAVGWIDTTLDLGEVDSMLESVIAGIALVGRTEQAELLQWLAGERARQRSVQARFDALTPREADVLSALADGLTAEEIARRHVVALTTVRTQIRAVLRKLGVRSQLAAVALADAHRSLLPPTAPAAAESPIIVPGDRPILPPPPIARSA
jgi:two-component system, NarL family, nitrate/nitrite response regulator NarL